MCLAMEFTDSIAFMKVKPSAVILALQLKIETKKYERLNGFETDKHLTVLQWEEIECHLNGSANDQIKHPNILMKGEFAIDGGLCVSFEVVPKDDSFINFKKLSFEYTLDWIIKVEITKTQLRDEMTGQNCPLTEVPEYTPNGYAESSSYTATKKESPNKPHAPLEYSPQRVTKSVIPERQVYTPSRIKHSPQVEVNQDKTIDYSTDDIEDEDYVPNSDIESSREVRRNCFENASKKIRPSKRPARVDSDHEQDTESNNNEPIKKRNKNKKLKANETKDKHKQPKITSMLNASVDLTDTGTSSNVTKRKVRLQKPELETEKKTSGKKTLDIMKVVGLADTQTMHCIKNFMTNAKQQDAHNEMRKEELRDLEMLNCRDLKRNELKKLFRNFKPTIAKLLTSDQRTRTKEYMPMFMTTANVLTEDQIMFLNEECNKLFKDEDICEEKDLMEVVVPEFIIHLFEAKFDLNRDETLKRLKEQEERRSLYQEDDHL